MVDRWRWKRNNLGKVHMHCTSNTSKERCQSDKVRKSEGAVKICLSARWEPWSHMVLRHRKTARHAAASYTDWKTFIFIKQANTVLMLPHGRGRQTDTEPLWRIPNLRLPPTVKKRRREMCLLVFEIITTSKVPWEGREKREMVQFWLNLWLITPLTTPESRWVGGSSSASHPKMKCKANSITKDRY